ncbi:PDZ domain-containing protein [Spirochaetota bacterium]
MNSKYFQIRNIIICALFIQFIFFSSHLLGDEKNAPDPGRATVKILQTYIMPNYNIPWRMKNPGSSVGSGVIIKGKYILTNAHVVSNSTYIQVQKENDPKRYDAEIAFIGHDCDLALLKVKDESFFDNTVPLNFGGLPVLKSKVTTFGYPVGGYRISVTKGIVSRIQLSRYMHIGDMVFLTIQTDAAINSGNSGGPVVQDNKIVGIAFQASKRSNNIGYMIPMPIIKHFLDDIKDGRYDGFPSMGIYVDTLRNKSFRKYMGMKDNQSGIIIKHVNPGGSSYGHLKVGDILLSFDNVPLANDGSIVFGNGRIYYAHLIDVKQIGDEVSLKVLRKGKIINLKYPLRGHAPKISTSNEYEKLPKYYIFGGIVFQVLSREYLKTWNKWWYNAERRMLYYYFYSIIDSIHPERKEFVVINRVLPDRANTYISDIKDELVNSINGMKINSLKDAVKALNSPAGKYHIIKVDGSNLPIVLKVSEARDANIRVKGKYGIKFLKRLK